MIKCPDPNGRESKRYLTDLDYRQSWDDADRKARAFTSLWNASEFAIPELPDDLNTDDYY